MAKNSVNEKLKNILLETQTPEEYERGNILTDCYLDLLRLPKHRQDQVVDTVGLYKRLTDRAEAMKAEGVCPAIERIELVESWSI